MRCGGSYWTERLLRLCEEGLLVVCKTYVRIIKAVVLIKKSRISGNHPGLNDKCLLKLALPYSHPTFQPSPAESEGVIKRVQWLIAQFQAQNPEARVVLAEGTVVPTGGIVPSATPYEAMPVEWRSAWVPVDGRSDDVLQ
jgi:hypothetical protein